MPQRFIAGVDLGATNIRVVIANEDGEVEARRQMPFDGAAPDVVCHRIGRTIDDLVRGVWVGAKVAAIGIALPGTVDPAKGVVASAANLPGWGDVALAELVGSPRNVPVAMENDANAAAIGEQWLGAARGLRDFVFIALGTGIGSGIVIDGRLHRGAHLLAGEVAFFPMTREHLRRADWQQCLEGAVGGRAVAATAARLVGPQAGAAALFDAARSGDGDAAAWLAGWLDNIAMAIADIVALLDPQAIVLGGGVAIAQGDWLIDALRERVHRATPTRTKLVMSELGEQAQVLGAVKLAIERVDQESAVR